MIDPYQKYTDEQIASAFVATFEKIDYRAKMIVRESKRIG